MELHLKKQEDALAEKLELIADLEEIQTDINICLAKKSKDIEALEDDVEQLTKQLLDTRQKLELKVRLYIP